MLRVEDWRETPADVVAPLVADEAREWHAELDWDVYAAWGPIEPARVAGRLPGLIVRDDKGKIRGWTCFLKHRNTLQVAMLVAEDAEASAALVEAIPRSIETSDVDIQTVCVRNRAPGLAEALRERGFHACLYRYLSAPASHWSAPDCPLSTWRPEDLDPLAGLCQRAYKDALDVRAFAPLDSIDEWREYVAGLVTGVGCGVLMPQASLVCREADSNDLNAAILTTHIGPGTAHIAQLVVDPDVRKRGTASALVAASMDAALRVGLRKMTLLVAEGNSRAAGIYDRFGFRDRGSFVVATNRQPWRLSNVALATGGASTRR